MVTNTTVAPLYLEKVTWALTHDNPNVSVESVILPDGEQYKGMVRVGFSVYLCFSSFHHLDVANFVVMRRTR